MAANRAERPFAASNFAIEGVQINLPTMDVAVSSIAEASRDGEAFAVYTLNLDHCVKLRSDPAFRSAYQRARYVTADGFPIVWLAWLFGSRVEQTTGADLVQPLCAEAARQGIPLYFFGSTAPVLREAAEMLCEAHPGLMVVGSHAPSRNFKLGSAESDEAIARISRSGARLCLVALGAPKQELFSDEALSRSERVGFACIGASLDFLAGTQVRAPRLLQQIKLEWMWRVLGNPRRLGPRYIRCALLLARYAASVPFLILNSSRNLGRA